MTEAKPTEADKRRRDRWGRDRNTGARGLEFGLRVVRSGAVKIDSELWFAVRGSLSAYEGKKVEVSVDDAWATRYTARDPESLQSIAILSLKPPATEEPRHAKR